MRFDVDTKASPAQVRRAFTDFTDRRPRILSRTLDPKTYEVREQGDTWAVARESTPGSPFWVVARYDWSEPDAIRWTVTESSYGGGGDGFVRIAARDGGGSRVHAEWTSTGARRSQKPLLFLLHHGPMHRLIARMWTSTLDRYARESSG
ncbi:SRPBCC family protein [Actinoplanes sp. NPDC051513]|uniref:SRPBCC family protein n=1 Tax=Actinoplanes sp. NPDC051513 TaxID=3363908 RepID=UPI0037AF0A70